MEKFSFLSFCPMAVTQPVPTLLNFSDLTGTGVSTWLRHCALKKVIVVRTCNLRRYKDTLATIGALGREAPGHSLGVLTQLLEGRLSRLHGQIQRLITQGNRSIDKVLGDLYEDLHWLILVAGNIGSKKY